MSDPVWRAVLVGGCALAFAACAGGNAQTQDSLFETGRYQDSYKLIQQQAGKEAKDDKESDFVLHNIRLAQAAFYDGNLALAVDHYKKVLPIIDSQVGAGAGGASLVFWQSGRYFKGAKYERAAINYYFGLASLLAKELTSARIGFANALLVDKSADEVKYQEDNAAAFFLLAHTYRAMGDSANAALALRKAAAAQPANTYFSPAHFDGDNLVLVVEEGPGPFRYTDVDADIFMDGRLNPTGAADVFIDDQPVGTTAMMTGWTEQMQTEGLSTSDKVQHGKAIANATARIAAEALKNMPFGIGLIAGAVSAVGHLASKADLRAWKFVPEAIWVLTAKVTPGVHRVSIRFRKQTPNYDGNRALDYSQGEPSPVVGVVPSGNYMTGYQETHRAIAVGSEPTVIVTRTYLGKQAIRDGVENAQTARATAPGKRKKAEATADAKIDGSAQPKKAVAGAPTKRSAASDPAASDPPAPAPKTAR